MSRYKERDINEKEFWFNEFDRSIYLVTIVTPESITGVSLETFNIKDITRDNLTFITTMKYMKDSLNSENVRDARKVIESDGSPVSYIGDGIYAINQHTPKATYSFGSRMMSLARDIMDKREEEKKKSIKKRVGKNDKSKH